ncbi:hypothetical protein [Gelatiniphilus marinus]|uniref:Uncharacterized protein n=1 Tax=Gelatiniphilus marinus TaxID=1759464 RepID=A0ABW5JTP6_9FLAO
MLNKIKSYKLSEEADFDIEAIFDYSHYYHGFNQAVKYLNDLDTVFTNWSSIQKLEENETK